MVNNWLSIIQDYCFPPNCIFCNQDGIEHMDICRECLKDLPINNYACHHCGIPMNPSPIDPPICGQCLSTPTIINSTIAPYRYQSQIAYLVKSLKYNSQYKNARLLGQLFCKRLPPLNTYPESLIPVPLHPKRYRQRRFNQSYEIARTISKTLNIPIDQEICKRTRNTEKQSKLSAKQRQKNVKQAFATTKTVPYNHVALIDDAMTTGNTVKEIARVLNKAGVERVDVWVCARAGL